MLKKPLWAASGIVLAAATFALAGCGDTSQPKANDSAPPTTSAPQVSAREAFTNATKKLNDTSVKAELTMDGAFTMTGTAKTDPVGKKAHHTNEVKSGSTNVKTEMISINNEIWMKMTGVAGVPAKWMHVAADKVKPGSALDISKDSSAQLDKGVVSVERDGATGFKGTLDLTKTGTTKQDLLKQLGDKAKAVPFTATVDAQGRLSTLVIDTTSLVPGMGKLTTTYSGYGDPVAVSPPPAAEVVEMPAVLLDAMNKSGAA